MRRWTRAAVGIVAGMLLAPPAAAQPEAFLFYGGVPGCSVDCGGTILRVTPDGPAVLSSLVDRAAEYLQSPYVTPDGRLLIWFTAAQGSKPARVAVRDTVTGVTSTLDFAGAGGLLGNPARSEVYVFDSAGPVALGPSSRGRFTGPTCSGSYPLSISADGRRLLVYCGGNGTPGQLNQSVLFDTFTGAFVKGLPPSTPAALNHDGTEVFVQEYVGGSPHLRRYAVATETLLADAAIPVRPFHPGPSVTDVRVDHRGQRVVMVGPTTHVFDQSSLQLLRSRNTALTGQVVGVKSVGLDESNALLYLTTFSISEGGHYHGYEVYDTNTLDLRVNLPYVANAEFVPAPKPLPPATLTATVSARDVALSWSAASAVPVTTRYVLEVGSASGRSDIFPGLDVGMQTSFAASAVPPGTYFVRLRAANYAGSSAPSHEVVVQVQ